MCMVSAIGDNYKDAFPQKWPQINPNYDSWHIAPQVSRSEFEALRAEVLELKRVLASAARFDKLTNQPHCEMDDKVGMIKALAKMVGVDMGDIFEDKPKSTVTQKTKTKSKS